MATLSSNVYKIESDWVNDRDWMAKEAAAKVALAAQVKAKRPKDPLAGEYWRWPVGDGYAVYIVESSAPLRLAHVAIGDEWRVPYALIRGLRRADVVQQVNAEKHLAKLFGSKS